MNAAFLVKKSVMQPGTWQVRVRDLADGNEATVDHLYTIAEAREKYDSMARTMRPMCERP